MPARGGTSQRHHAFDRIDVSRNLPDVVVQRVPSNATNVSGISFCVTVFRVSVGASSPLRRGMAQPASVIAASAASVRQVIAWRRRLCETLRATTSRTVYLSNVAS